MNRTLPLLASLALLAAASAQADDSLRCNSALVSTGDSSGAVLRKCGEPVIRSAMGTVKVTDHRVVNASESQSQSTEVLVEQWTYGPTYGMYHYLRFEGDKLVKIVGERG
jgi:hypothetical protein